MVYEHGDEYAIKSYAQEGEDILLHRILERIPKGTYIDIGAHHPFRFSNTYNLYKRGWSGICIDPNPDISHLFDKFRPKDIFINIGVSEKPSLMRYYQYEHPAYNTCDLDLVTERKNVKPISETTITTKTLSSILNEHLQNNQKINLMSIDVEGMDFEVLKSNDWKKYRPDWIFLETDILKIKEYLGSEMHVFMESNGYKLYSKLFKSILYAKE